MWPDAGIALRLRCDFGARAPNLPDVAVERCLACEAVVSRADGKDKSVDEPGSCARETTDEQHRAQTAISRCLPCSRCSPRPRKRGSAPRLARVRIRLAVKRFADDLTLRGS